MISNIGIDDVITFDTLIYLFLDINRTFLEKGRHIIGTLLFMIDTYLYASDKLFSPLIVLYIPGRRQYMGTTT